MTIICARAPIRMCLPPSPMLPTYFPYFLKTTFKTKIVTFLHIPLHQKDGILEEIWKLWIVEKRKKPRRLV